MRFTTAVRQVLLVSGKGDPGPSLPSWTTTLDVKLAERDQAEHVKLTVHTSAQMTLEWPAFGGVWAGRANFVALPNIKTFSVVSDASRARDAGQWCRSTREYHQRRRLKRDIDLLQSCWGRHDDGGGGPGHLRQTDTRH